MISLGAVTLTFGSIGQYGLIGSLSTSIMNAIPGSSNVTLPYPKEMPLFSPGTDIGTTQLVQYVTDYHHACPATKQVLIGYSMGGIIVMNGACGALAPFADTSKLVILLRSYLCRALPNSDENG